MPDGRRENCLKPDHPGRKARTALMMTVHATAVHGPAPTSDLRQRGEAMAAAAAQHAAEVDREARFPAEAFAAARAQRLLGILVPIALGGEGGTVSDVVDLCYQLGRACSSTAMIFAMHQ